MQQVKCDVFVHQILGVLTTPVILVETKIIVYVSNSPVSSAVVIHILLSSLFIFVHQRCLWISKKYIIKQKVYNLCLNVIDLSICCFFILFTFAYFYQSFFVCGMGCFVVAVLCNTLIDQNLKKICPSLVDRRGEGAQFVWVFLQRYPVQVYIMITIIPGSHDKKG